MVSVLFGIEEAKVWEVERLMLTGRHGRACEMYRYSACIGGAPILNLFGVKSPCYEQWK